MKQGTFICFSDLNSGAVDHQFDYLGQISVILNHGN